MKNASQKDKTAVLLSRYDSNRLERRHNQPYYHGAGLPLHAQHNTASKWTRPHVTNSKIPLRYLITRSHWIAEDYGSASYANYYMNYNQRLTKCVDEPKTPEENHEILGCEHYDQERSACNGLRAGNISGCHFRFPF